MADRYTYGMIVDSFADELHLLCNMWDRVYVIEKNLIHCMGHAHFSRYFRSHAFISGFAIQVNEPTLLDDLHDDAHDSLVSRYF